ncbi:hypothetical protein J4408_01430 [Candidatus Pacearchaeota archaeon]|nr:hypothetical protein [Candidatus Pacearchaeota archaeon]
MDQETVMRASFIEKQLGEIDQHIELLDSQIIDLSALRENLTIFSESKEKEILSSFGRGIFLKAQLQEKIMFVEVGSGIVVKKTPEQTLEVVENQLGKLEEARLQIGAQREMYYSELYSIIQKVEETKNKDKK